MTFRFGPRRGIHVDLSATPKPARPLSAADVDHVETLDLVHRCRCALPFNYVPTSGHPGGSISSGRIVAGLLYDALDDDLARPSREDADIISYAAGHKALGLCAMWAIRDEIARLAAPDHLPQDPGLRLRLEDRLGFRRNPAAKTPLARQFGAKALDGHPTPATPFVRLATGASGVGVASSLGLAIRRAGLLRQRRSARPYRRGRGRIDPRTRRRGSGGCRHRLAGERDRSPGLEPGLDRSLASGAAAGDLPGGASARGDGDHRLHPADVRRVRSDIGRSMALHPFPHGHFLGSGQGDMVLAEAGLDGASQHRAITTYVERLRASR